MIDHTKVKLGKAPARLDERTLFLSSYLVKDELPPIPDTCDWGKSVDKWGLYRNDEIGDCAIVGPANQIHLTHDNAGRPWTPPESEVIKAYSALTKYDPQTGKNDTGCVMLDVMNYWRYVGIAGNKIQAYVGVNPRNIKQVRTALYLFGGLIAGCGLPLSAQNQEVWDVVDPYLKGDSMPYSWGGHCVLIPSYDPWRCVTWGELQSFTPAWLATYCDELFAVVAKGWIKDSGKSPSGFDYQTLMADLQKVTR